MLKKRKNRRQKDYRKNRKRKNNRKNRRQKDNRKNRRRKGNRKNELTLKSLRLIHLNHQRSLLHLRLIIHLPLT